MWTHEESFSKHEVVLNLDLFPGVAQGDLMALVPLKADLGTREHQEKTQGTKKDTDNLSTAMQRDRSHSNPQSLSQGSGTESKPAIDIEKRYLFIAKERCRDMKEKPQGLEVSVAKHIADIFGLKHRSNVLVSTVRSQQHRGETH